MNTFIFCCNKCWLMFGPAQVLKTPNYVWCLQVAWFSAKKFFDTVRNFCLKLRLEISMSNPQMTFKGSENTLKVWFETGSDLCLGTCLTRVKRLSRKRCCDTTPDRCQEGSRLTILFRISSNASPSSRLRVGGIPGPKPYHEKNTPSVDACARIHFQMRISD